jgi:NAD(P)-dependent dehydrogenase (short-subunit alcohol dehydrogenase family)
MIDQRILISGGASGIGLACAQRFAQLGARIVLLDLSANLEVALASLSGSGHTAHRLDVTDPSAVEDLIAQEFLAAPISGLVVSAGIVSQDALLEISAENFAKVFNVNVFGVQNVVAAVAKGMIAESVQGSIVVLSSVAAFNGGGLMGKGAYSASKAALLGLVRSYARELAPLGIRINNVAPGATETPMTSSLSEEARAKILAQMLNGRFLDPKEIVGAIKFLLSEDSAAVNGQTLHANGGAYFG